MVTTHNYLQEHSMEWESEKDSAWEEGMRNFSFNMTMIRDWQLSPAEELRNRLNTSLQGKDPGPPLHWKGL